MSTSDNLDALYNSVWNGYVRQPEPTNSPPNDPTAPTRTLPVSPAPASSQSVSQYPQLATAPAPAASSILPPINTNPSPSSHYSIMSPRSPSSAGRTPRPLPPTPGSPSIHQQLHPFSPATSIASAVERSSTIATTSTNSRQLPSTPSSEQAPPYSPPLPPPPSSPPPPPPLKHTSLPPQPPPVNIHDPEKRRAGVDAPSIMPAPPLFPSPYPEDTDAIPDTKPSPVFDPWSGQSPKHPYPYTNSNPPKGIPPALVPGVGVGVGGSSPDSLHRPLPSRQRSPPLTSSPASSVHPYKPSFPTPDHHYNDPNDILIPPPPPPPEVRETIESLKRINSVATPRRHPPPPPPPPPVPVPVPVHASSPSPAPSMSLGPSNNVYTDNNDEDAYGGLESSPNGMSYARNTAENGGSDGPSAGEKPPILSHTSLPPSYSQGQILNRTSSISGSSWTSTSDPQQHSRKLPSTPSPSSPTSSITPAFRAQDSYSSLSVPGPSGSSLSDAPLLPTPYTFGSPSLPGSSTINGTTPRDYNEDDAEPVVPNIIPSVGAEGPEDDTDVRPSSSSTPMRPSYMFRTPTAALSAIRQFDYSGDNDDYDDRGVGGSDHGYGGDDGGGFDDEGEWLDTYSTGSIDDPQRFVNPSLLSHLAVQLKDKVPRATHVKGSIPYPKAFTGKDIVSTIQSLIQREMAITHGVSTSNRNMSLQVARSLQSQLFFVEVEWGGGILQDGVEDVFMFLDESDFGSAELPTGVITALTKCYSATCLDDQPCYSRDCPRKKRYQATDSIQTTEPPPKPVEDTWTANVSREILQRLPPPEVNRQTIIHKLISKEQAYLHDLDIIEHSFLQPLIRASSYDSRVNSDEPPIIPPSELDEFIDTVFANILDLRECNRRLLEAMYVRQREQSPVISRIGDIFLGAAAEFRLGYIEYTGNLPRAKERLAAELKNNGMLANFLEHCGRTLTPQNKSNSVRMDLLHYLNRPQDHLSRYSFMLQAVLSSTAEGNPDEDFLSEAINSFKNIEEVAKLRQWQKAMGKPVYKAGAEGDQDRKEIQEWHDLLDQDREISKAEKKRQMIMFELIKGEMAYVKNLENIEPMYIDPLRNADPPIIDPGKVEPFIHDVFHNYQELHAHHTRLLEKLHEIQRDEYPLINSVVAPILDAVLNFRDAYLDYIPNYPIAAYRIDDEVANNPAFAEFVQHQTRHPDAHRHDMKNYVHRPIPRLLRYELLLKNILDETPKGHSDLRDIPQLVDQIKALGKETEPGVMSAKTKVQLWTYNSSIVFKPGEWIDMDLLNPNRSLIYTGKLLRQPDRGRELNGWSELFMLLFDNYLVLTKARAQRDGAVQYQVSRRPIPLELLTLVNFSDPPTQRSQGLLRGFRGDRTTQVLDSSAAPDIPGVRSSEAVDSRLVFPCTIHYTGREGGTFILYAESAQIRTEWKDKLIEALGLRNVVQESNKVFEIETLSVDTFVAPSVPNGGVTQPSWDPSHTGRVTCSVPFTTQDGRELVAIGCAEGVWIGFRHDSRSMRRVLHLKMVMQCAMLEAFGLFLVLADKSLFAYHIEALVPSTPHSVHASQTPQKLSGTKDVHFFSVGNLHGRTLIVYMKKKNLDSVFHVLEPVLDKIQEGPKAPQTLSSRFLLKSTKSEWFRPFREFFLPSETYDIIFLKAKIAILCSKGFEIMDLNDYNSVTIPQKDDPSMEKLVKRCEEGRPLGMFRSREDEFLLCYNEFGLYVNKHGEPSRKQGVVEWEGTADRVALHNPYILLFDSRFIEIRHLETGRLAQIIAGNDVHCLWDGRNTTNPSMMSPILESSTQEPHVHAAMNTREGLVSSGGRRSRTVAQHVFEMIPTVPLYNPGPLTAPGSNSYFPTSYSPPRSPP